MPRGTKPQKPTPNPNTTTVSHLVQTPPQPRQHHIHMHIALRYSPPTCMCPSPWGLEGLNLGFKAHTHKHTHATRRDFGKGHPSLLARPRGGGGAYVALLAERSWFGSNAAWWLRVPCGHCHVVLRRCVNLAGWKICELARAKRK